MATQLLQDPKVLVSKLEAFRSASYLAVDTEFIRESTFFPRIALIQIATDQETLLIDPLAFKKEELVPLQELLLDPKVLKFMHAAYADQECFYWTYGYLADPVLDTAAAAALLGYGDNIGLSKLLKDVLDLHIPKGRSRVKWLERPLSRELLDYAELDVRYLVRLGKTLLKKLETKKRENWALRLSKILPENLDESPEKIAARLGKNAHWGDRQGYPVLLELVRWREARAKELNIPRHWLCDNDVLLSIAKVKPKSLPDLKTFRGLSAKEVDRSGEKILKAIERGLAQPETNLEEVNRRPRSSGVPDPVVDLIQTYIYFLAGKLEIVPRHLLTTEQSERLVEHADAPVEEWVRRKIMSPESAELVGKDLQEFLAGKKALSIKNRQLTVLSVPKS